MSGYKFASVGSRFKRQLGELMEALQRMEPHYIRCIKPNSRNRCACRPPVHPPAASSNVPYNLGCCCPRKHRLIASAASFTRAMTS